MANRPNECRRDAGDTGFAKGPYVKFILRRINHSRTRILSTITM